MRMFLLIATLATLSMSTIARADMITYVQGSLPTAAYTHQDASVRNDLGQTTAKNNSARILVGGLSGASFRGLMSFNLVDIPTNAIVNSISLRMRYEADTATSPSVGGVQPVVLRSINNTFSESTATWDNTFGSSMTLGTTNLSTVNIDPEGAGFTTFASTSDFVSLAQTAVTNGSPLNFAIFAPNADAQTPRNIFRFFSNNDGTAANRPELSVDFTATPVPEPSSIMLVAGGLALAAYRRRRATHK